MKKVISKTNLFVALLVAFIACLIGATTLSLTAHVAYAQEADDTVTLTSYTSVMFVGEDFEFAASTEVTWESSDSEVIEIDETGYAIAVGEGNSTITATAADGSYVSIDVLVSDEAILVEGVTIDPDMVEIPLNGKAQLNALVLPEDATDQTVTWKSSNESIATVDADGIVTAIGEGQATITVTTNDHMYTAECAVTVVEIGKAMLSAESLTLKVNEIGELTVTLPNGAVAETYEWTSSTTEVATPGVNSTATAPIYTWSFGSTIITVNITDTNGAKYQATATVTVSADFFYLVGLNDNWTTYETADEAEAAGVLLTPVEGQPNVYAITRSVPAYSGFQIIHSGMDADWTTKITPYWYSADGSSDEYVANTVDTFQVTLYGSYTVTLDLNDGMAKVYINMQDIFVTEINLSLTEGDTVLNSLEDYALIGVELLPKEAKYNPEDIKISVTDSTMAEDAEGESTYVTYTFDAETMTIRVEPVSLPEDDVTVYVKVTIDEAESVFQLNLTSKTVVAPTRIEFTQEVYELDVNNGGLDWTATVLAEVDADATVKNVTYSTTDAGITIDSVTGVVTASAFGTFTVTATAVGNPELSATAQVVVYSSAFYLIGTLDGTIPNNWIALDNETYRTLEGTPFENWGLTSVDGSLTEYSGEFVFDENDRFAIVFLGMDPGTWYGAINSANFDEEASSTQYVEIDETNVKILADGKYEVKLTLGANGPRFSVELLELHEFVAYDLYTYLLRAGDAWDGSKSAVENMLVSGGFVTVDGENNTTLTFRYNFSGMTPWAVFQFITATGTEGGFADATWYASDESVEITGDAYGNEDGKFWNDGAGCQFWYVGASMPDEIPEVEFTVSFDATGHITAIVMNFVTETPAD